SVLGFFFFYMVSFALLTLVFSLFVGDLTLGLSAVGQALGNVGPGLVPSIGPVGHFGGLPDGAKWVLSLAMLLGRLELLTVLVLFLPTFWRG
ncbi:MAG: potassium transporter TrkH, partial [Dongiaceae bacterium]